jgi:predicted acylesterase/phospholipase RssA
LTTRLVALATAMFEHAPPASHVVVGGTLGAAVQASGAAPVLFAPTVKQTSLGEARFADGATSAFIPARILRDRGADVIFAFNCLAGPKNGHPLAAWVHALPLADRITDLWVSASYLAQRIGREADEDAHVYFEPDEERQPLIESFEFPHGRAIAEASARCCKVARCIDDCLEVWTQFSRYR